MDAEVAIVGAGPAGCAAAYDLAKAGISVLLVDRERTRPKPCGGGLTVRTLRSLRYRVDPVVRTVCTDLRLSHRQAREKLVESGQQLCAMTDRWAFDEFCLETTKRAGAGLQVVKRVEAVREQPDGVELETDTGTVRSKFLIGADGADSRVRKLTGQFAPTHDGVAIEGDLPIRWRPQEIVFDFEAVPEGYGWIFPKGDHLNVGVCAWSPSAKVTPALLDAYARSRLGTSVPNPRGQRIGTGGWAYEPSSRRGFLAGDAAGMAEPLLGEGIGNAVRSGQAAAAAILHELRGHGEALRELKRRLRPIRVDIASRHASGRIFYADQSRGFSAITSPYTRQILVKGYALGLPFWALRWLGWWALARSGPVSRIAASGGAAAPRR